LPSWLHRAQQAAGQSSGGHAGSAQLDDLPPWLQQRGPAAAGSQSGMHGRGADPRDFSASRIRANDPRSSSYRGRDYSDDGWREDDDQYDRGYDDQDEDQDDERQDRGRRRGFLGFLRKR